MADYSLKVDYAVSGRAQCRGCWNKIEKGVLRIAYVIDVDNYHNQKWFHIDCFKYLPNKVSEVELNEISGYDHLNPSDKKLLDSKIYQLKNMPEEQQKELCKKEAKKRKIMKKEYLNKGKRDSRLMDYDDPYDDQEFFKQEFNLRKSQSREVIEISDDEGPYLFKPRKQPMNQLRAYFKQEDPLDQKPDGYNEEEWFQYKRAVVQIESKSNAILKELLRYNDQVQTGQKNDLIDRVADCMILGAIPKCPRCRGGKLIFDKQTGVYTCTGFNDESEFINCNKEFQKDDIQRSEWLSF